MTSRFKAFCITSLLMTGFFAPANRLSAASSLSPFSGNLVGSVVDAVGTPQMGASVLLFDRYERFVKKALTSPDGRFGFAGLSPDSYSIRISLPSFLPASRNQIEVKPGLSSVLQIRLNSLFSDIEVSYTIPSGVMTDDWKWVLRSSTATRPITRLLPASSSSDPGAATLRTPIFSSTRGMISISGGDGPALLDAGQNDFGTAFALATTVYGKNQVQVSGAMGTSSRTGLPEYGVRATYSRGGEGELAHPPEVTLMVRQIYLAGNLTASANQNNGALLRTSTLSFYDVADPVENLHIEYGTSLESVGYMDRTGRVSPFGRATLTLGKWGEAAAAFSNGGVPMELTLHQADEDANLANVLNVLSSMPQMSMRGGHLELQRTQSYEIGYSKAVKSMKLSMSAFHEAVADGRLSAAGDVGILNSGDLLPDATAKTSVYNIGAYSRNGYLVAANQRLNSAMDVTLAYGRMGGFMKNGAVGADGTAGGFLTLQDHNLASLSTQATLPKVGTRLVTSYEWVADNAIVTRHIFETQSVMTDPGLNMGIRQPLPSLFGIPGRLEISADVRNLLAEGYLSANSPDGRRVLLVQSPRSVRGGLSFIF